jgi:hypothetical protein
MKLDFTIMLDLHRLRMLREIVVRGTVAAAADALAYTPSALSQQMATLRREVGAPLFEREGRTLRPTATARLLARHADAILDAVAAAESAVAASLEEVSGDVAVGSFATGAYRLVAPGSGSTWSRWRTRTACGSFASARSTSCSSRITAISRRESLPSCTRKR